MVTINGIPVYDALITDEDTGMFRISLVDDPAVMSNFQSFSNKKVMQMYAVTDEERRLVRGCVMRADFPIYRLDSRLGEYYIIYKAEEIRKMAEKYLVDGLQNAVNLMHEDDSDVTGVQMVQYFIKGDGISVEGFDECADGSLFAEFHVTNDEVWDAIKDGTYKGFSLEGYFELAPETEQKKTDEIVDALEGAFSRIFKHSNNRQMSKLSRFKAALAKALQEFASITTDKGILAWDGEEDLKAGDSVYIEDTEGERTPATDGDYKTEDGKVIVVADGKVTEIKDAEAEVAPEEMETIATDKGDLSYEGELAVGTEVFVTNEEGESVPAPDGDYKVEGKTIKIADGKVTEIAEDSDDAGGAEVDAKRQRFAKVRQAYEDSYEEKERRLIDAISATLAEGEYAYLVEAGDGYVVVCVYTEENWEGKYFKYEVTWAEDGTPTISNPIEVKSAFIPVDAPNPADTASEELERLRKENEQLRKQSGAKPAHEEVVTTMQFAKTGIKGLDNLARKLASK